MRTESDGDGDAARRALASGLGVGISARVITGLVETGAAILAARLLGAAGLGTYAAAVAVASLVSLLVGLQLSVQATRSTDMAWTRDKFPWAAIAGGLGGVVTLFVALALGALGGTAIAKPLAWLSVVVIAAPMTDLVAGGLLAGGKASRAVIIRSGSTLGRFLVLLLLFLTTAELTPLTLAVLQGTITILVLISTLLIGRRQLGVRWSKPKKADLREPLRQGTVLLIVAATWIIVQRTDLLMIAALTGAEAAGRYQVTLRLLDLPLQLYAATLLMFLPSIAALGKRKDLLPGLYRSAAFTSSGLLIPGLAILAMIGPRIAGALFGADFIDGSLTYGILMAGGWFHVVSGPVGYMLVASKRNRALLISSVLTVSSNLALNILLIGPYGTLGAAWATSVSLVLSNALYVTFARMLLGNVRDYARYVLWVTVLTLSAGIAGLALQRVPSDVDMIVGSVVAAVGLAMASLGVSSTARTTIRTALQR